VKQIVTEGEDFLGFRVALASVQQTKNASPLKKTGWQKLKEWFEKRGTLSLEL
jgi:hypothetical protein